MRLYKKRELADRKNLSKIIKFTDHRQIKQRLKEELVRYI